MLSRIFLATLLVGTMAASEGIAGTACRDGLEGMTGSDALPCLLYAAEQGDARAQYHLGFVYAEGRCGPPNFKEAYSWWAAAAMNGIAMARQQMEGVSGRIAPGEFEAAQLAAMEKFLRTRRESF